MKIKIIGNSCTWTNRPNPQYLINDEMLVDTPQSSTKFLFGSYDFEKLKYIVITHFHSDHFADLHIIYDALKKRTKNLEKVTVVGPKTLFKRLMGMFKIFELGYRKKKDVKQIFNIIELKDGDKITLGDYEIEMVKVKHNVKYPFGFILKQKGSSKTIGFSGDSAMCDGLIKIIKMSDIVFLDCVMNSANNIHLSADEILLLQKEFKGKTFYSTHHVPDQLPEKYQGKIILPPIGKTYQIK